MQVVGKEALISLPGVTISETDISLRYVLIKLSDRAGATRASW